MKRTKLAITQSNKDCVSRAGEHDISKSTLWNCLRIFQIMAFHII